MGYFKDTCYYGPNCQDLSDTSPEAQAERKLPANPNHRVVYRQRITEQAQERYFATNQEARAYFRRLRGQGYIGAVQWWSVRENMWIG